MMIQNRFTCGEQVYLDGDAAVRYLIVGVQLFERGNQYLCAWVKANGDHDERWFDEWRLTKCETK